MSDQYVCSYVLFYVFALKRSRRSLPRVTYGAKNRCCSSSCEIAETQNIYRVWHAADVVIEIARSILSPS